MDEGYDRDAIVGVLGTKPIPKIALQDERSVSLDVTMFLMFIHQLNDGEIA